MGDLPGCLSEAGSAVVRVNDRGVHAEATVTRATRASDSQSSHGPALEVDGFCAIVAWLYPRDVRAWEEVCGNCVSNKGNDECAHSGRQMVSQVGSGLNTGS